MSRVVRLPALLVLAGLASTAAAVPSPDGITFLGGVEGAPSAGAAAVSSDPCEGVNRQDEDYFDPAFMGGPLVGFDWVASADATLTRLEVLTGEVSATSFLAVWSDNGGAPAQPLASLGATGAFMTAGPVTWYGADLLVPVPVTAGTKYWLVWDPSGNEQVSATDDPTDVIPTYWGSNTGDVNGGASWFGPFSFADRRWKFRAFCDSGSAGDADGDGVPDADDACPDTVFPEPLERLGVNRWAMMDDDDVFDTTPPEGVGPKVTFTSTDTRGCACRQIAEALHVGDGHDKFGCSTGIMRRWVDLMNP